VDAWREAADGDCGDAEHDRALDLADTVEELRLCVSAVSPYARRFPPS
jgi:hypothetical protein